MSIGYLDPLLGLSEFDSLLAEVSMKAPFQGLTCRKCRRCEEAVDKACDTEGRRSWLRQFAAIVAVISFWLSSITGQYVIVALCCLVSLTVFVASFFVGTSTFAHSVARAGSSKQWVHHTHIYDVGNEKLRVAMPTLVIDYRFGRVIAHEHLPEEVTVHEKMVGRGIVYSHTLYGKHPVLSVRQALIEIATYEPPRSA